MDDRLERFRCRRCGNCCRWPGYVRLDGEEIGALAAELGLTEDELIQHHTRLTGDRRGLSLLENADGSCVFLEETPEGAACRIQRAKPRQCREFPKIWNFPGWEKECAGGAFLSREGKDHGKQS